MSVIQTAHVTVWNIKTRKLLLLFTDEKNDSPFS